MVYKVAKIPIIIMQYIIGIPVVIFKAIEGAYITKPNQVSLNTTYRVAVISFADFPNLVRIN